MSFPITCTACHKTFTISDEIFEKKVSGRVVTIKCKSCGAGIRVDGTKGGSGASAPPETTAAPAAAAAPVAAAASAEPSKASGEALWAVDYPDGEDREFSTAEVVAELERGAIERATLVWRDGMGEWLELHQVPELALELAKIEAKKAAAAKAALPKTAATHKPRAPMPTVTGLAGLPGAGGARLTQPSTPELAKPRASQASTPELAKPRAAQPSTPELPRPRAQQPSSPELPRPRAQQPSSPELPRPRAQQPSAPVLPKPAATPPPVPPQTLQMATPFAALSPGPPPFAAPPPPLAAPAPFAPAGPPPLAPPAPPPALPPPLFDLEPPLLATPPLPPSVAKVVSRPPQIPAFPGAASSPSQSPAAAFGVGPAVAAHASVEWPQAKSKAPLIVGALVVVALLVGGGVFLLGDKAEPPPSTPISALPASPAAAPTPTPASPAPPSPAATVEGSETASGSDPIAAPPDQGATPGAGFAELFAAGARKAESKGASVTPSARFDAAATKAPLAEAATQAQACKQSGGPTGKVTVVVTFDPNGKASSATITEAPFAGTSTGACISSALKRASIAPFSGLPGTVSKTFSIL